MYTQTSSYTLEVEILLNSSQGPEFEMNLGANRMQICIECKDVKIK